MAEGRGDTSQIDHNGAPLDDLIDTLTGGTLGRVRYAWQTATGVADPGAGNIRYNSGVIGSVTSLIVSQTDKAALDQAGWFGTFDDSSSTVKGQITITNDFGGSALSNVFNVTGAPTDAGAYWTIPVAYVQGALPAAGNTSVVLSFVRTGDKGLETIAAGSASAPSIAPTGDSNTGFWFPAADTIAAGTAGVERTRITSAGFFGVGCTPNARIQVSGLINFDPALDATFLGENAGGTLATGTYNTGVGWEALRNVTSGYRNTMVGATSGRYITDGFYNAALGWGSLAASVSGQYNCAVGSRAMENAVTGNYNTAIGNNAMLTTAAAGLGNVAVGHGTLDDMTGNYNVGIGYINLNAAVSGLANVAIGGYAMRLTAAAGTGSTAVGYGSLENNTGDYNCAVGYQSMSANTSGNYNFSGGYRSLYTNITGIKSVGVGSHALYYNSDADNCVAIGYYAGRGSSAGYTAQGLVCIGYQAGGNGLATGADYNTLIGASSGYGITTGAGNTLIGYSDGSSASYNQVTTGSRNIAIGYNVAVPDATASDQLCIGNGLYGTGLSANGASISVSAKFGFGTKGPGAQVDISHTTGGVLRLSRNDTGLTVDEVLGKIEFHTNDTDDTSVRASIVALKDDGASSRAPTALILSTGDASAGTLFERLRITSAGVVRPGADNTQDLGTGSLRWGVVYAGTGSINTSDERYKILREGGDLSDAEYLAWSNVRHIVYRDKDSFARKGNEARLHIGYSWQAIKAAFEDQDLDASRYALWCEDRVTALVTKTRTAKRQALDENGVGLTQVVPVLENGEPVMEQAQAFEVTEKTVSEVRMVAGVPTLFETIRTLRSPLFDEVQVTDSVTGELKFEMVQATDPETGALLFDEVQKTDPFYGHPMTHEVQETEEVTVLAEEVQMVDGAPVLVKVPRTVQQPVFDLVQVRDAETGKLLFREVDGEQQPMMVEVPRMVTAPLMVEVPRMVSKPVVIEVPRMVEQVKTEEVPVMEEFEETYEVREETGETIGALRYQECAVLEAAWLRRELAQLADRVAALEEA